MRLRRCFWLLVVLSSAIVFPQATRADTIRVTSGFFDWALNGGQLIGERGFSAHVGAPGGPALYVFCDEASGCAPGSSAEIRHAWGGLDLPVGPLTFEGNTYVDANSLDGPANFEIGFQSRVTFPPLAQSAVLRTPFGFEGALALTRREGSWVTHTLVGSGILTSSWRPDESLGGNAWFATAQHYDFTAAAPVPEPTTVVLTGLAAAAFTRRRKRMR